MPKDKKPKIIIEGITESGEKFRPSDWAERIGGNLSTFKNHRIYYSPLLRPSYIEGHRCLILDPELKNLHPGLYQYILDFAKQNRLKMCDEKDLEDNSEK